MPYITVESGVLSDEQKELFVTTIKEVSDKNFGIGGKTIDKIKLEYIKRENVVNNK